LGFSKTSKNLLQQVRIMMRTCSDRGNTFFSVYHGIISWENAAIKKAAASLETAALSENQFS
jgi:hypothetical protein